VTVGPWGSDISGLVGDDGVASHLDIAYALPGLNTRYGVRRRPAGGNVGTRACYSSGSRASIPSFQKESS